MSKEKEVYVVKKCIYWDRQLGNIEWCQIENKEGSSLFWPNFWLGRLTQKTAKQYAYKLVSFLNFLSKSGKTYMDATEKDLNRFLTNLRFLNGGGIYAIDSSNRRRTTIQSYIAAISNFYTTLDNFRDDLKIKIIKEKGKVSKYSFLYNVVWTKETKKLLIDVNIEKYKPKKKYVKWYEDDEIKAILSNLRTYRDKAIFELSLVGMRIDEVLSLRMEDYDSNKGYVVAFRSKGKMTGETGRAVALKKSTIKALEDYLMFERAVIEEKMFDKGEIISDEIFVNLRCGATMGKPLGYRNYLEILKIAASKAGLDPKEIRTHSGRSTAVMRDILYHSEHPDELTLDDIRIKYGWASMTSMEPYLDTSNPNISIQNRKLLDKVRNAHKERFIREKTDE